jgi:hypothetical protein
MHTALIFKEQAKVKDTGFREKVSAQPHYLIQHIEEYYLLCYKDYQQDLNSSTIETIKKDYCPSTMNTQYIRDRQEQKRLSVIP